MAKVWVRDLIIHLILLLKSLMRQLVLINAYFRRYRLFDSSCKMLGKTQVLSSSETFQIISGLEKIKVEYLRVNFLQVLLLKIFIIVLKKN